MKSGRYWCEYGSLNFHGRSTENKTKDWALVHERELLVLE